MQWQANTIAKERELKKRDGNKGEASEVEGPYRNSRELMGTSGEPTTELEVAT